MKLTILNCYRTPVSDLSPLRGMPLTLIYCQGSKVSDLSPLQGMNLTEVGFTPKDITKGLDIIRQMKSVKSIVFASTANNKLPPAEFWKKFDAGEFGKPITTLNAPVFQKWMKDVAAMSAEKQVEAVAKKLVELNPGFDGVVGEANGKGVPKIENGVVVQIGFLTDNVTDLSPVRALPDLKGLHCSGSSGGRGRLTDVSPLQGMKLRNLGFSNTRVSDLSSLEGQPVESINFNSTPVADISFLRGTPIDTLVCQHTPVSDLSPLKQSKIKYLDCSGTKVSDLSLLKDCKKLGFLGVDGTKVTPASVAALQKALPNCKIHWDDPAKPAAKKLAHLDPAFQQWMKETQALPAEKQIEAVSKKLVELNPGFDGTMMGIDVNGNGIGTPKIENGVVAEIGFDGDNIADLSPVRALAGLRTLSCRGSTAGKGKVSDLSPLQGMKLTRLYCFYTQVSDLSPLRGMPLTLLACSGTQVSDLSPLKGMPLVHLSCSATMISDLSSLQGMPLTRLGFYSTQVSDLSPLKGMPLTHLDCGSTQVADLSPLLGMDLTDIALTPTNITKGLDAIRQMKSLKTIGLRGDRQIPPDEFWRKYDAGEFGKPITTFNDPAFQQWVKATQALPAEKQIEAVSKKLVELNPGFDGTMMGSGRDGKGAPTIENGVVTQLKFFTEHVTDISPVRALIGLKSLSCSSGNGQLSDLSPLQGMQLTSLHVRHTQVFDLSPLKGMPLHELSCENTPVSDLLPLAGVPTLYTLSVKSTKITAAGVAALQRALPNCKIDWDDPAKPKTPEPAASGTK